MMSTRRPHATTRCHSVFSCFWPWWSFQVRVVASENVATRWPPPVLRISGSWPRFPIRIALFRLRDTAPPLPPSVRSRRRNGLSYPKPDSLSRKISHAETHHERVLRRQRVVPRPPADHYE